MAVNPNNNAQQAQMLNAVIAAISNGVIQAFAQYMPNIMINPIAPVEVKRVAVDDFGNEHTAVTTTNLAQLIAELNDNLLRLSDIEGEALDQIGEEEEEPPKRKRRK